MYDPYPLHFRRVHVAYQAINIVKRKKLNDQFRVIAGYPQDIRKIFLYSEPKSGGNVPRTFHYQGAFHHFVEIGRGIYKNVFAFSNLFCDIHSHDL
jgi:hypothetical protein